jgi:hypothetical protein
VIWRKSGTVRHRTRDAEGSGLTLGSLLKERGLRQKEGHGREEIIPQKGGVDQGQFSAWRCTHRTLTHDSSRSRPEVEQPPTQCGAAKYWRNRPYLVTAMMPAPESMADSARSIVKIQRDN